MLNAARGEIDVALELANSLVEQDSSNLVARIALGAVAVKERSFSRALQEFSYIGSGPLGALSKGILSAWAAQGLGNTGEAIKIINEMDGPDWFPLFTAYHLGLIFEMEGRYEEAAAQFAIAYDIDRRNLRRKLAYARSLTWMGRNQDALTVLARHNAVSEDHPYIVAAQQAISQNRQPQSDVLNARDGAAEILFGLGSAIELQGGNEYVAIFLQMAKLLKPEMDLALIELAEFFEENQQIESALMISELIGTESPLWRQAQIQIGQYHGSLKNLDEAEQVLSALIEMNPRDLEASMILGNLFRTNDQFAKAAEVYGKAEANLPAIEGKHWRLFYVSGIANDQIDNWPKAESDFLRALELKPNQPMVLNYLGYSWVDRGQNLDRALGMINSAVTQQPSSGYIVDSLGWVFFKLGRYEEAVVQLEKAVGLKPEDPVINDHLGDAYWQVGRRLEAHFQWIHARDLDPTPEDLEYILKKIEHGYVTKIFVPDSASNQNQ